MNNTQGQFDFAALQDRITTTVNAAVHAAVRAKTPPPASAEYWTVAEAARYLRCSADHISELCAEGHLDARNIAHPSAQKKAWRILAASVRAYGSTPNSQQR